MFAWVTSTSLTEQARGNVDRALAKAPFES
jgi:hypothetical protein